MVRNAKKGKIVACLDMGSSKLVCIIASISSEGPRILGYGHKESLGIKASAISDMRLAQKSIINVVSEAERMAGFNIDRLLVGISGSQVTSSRREISIKIGSDVVRSSEVLNLAAKVRSEFRKKNREIIHLIPLQYRIDDSEPVVNPRYMSGDKLYAKFHAISTSHTTIRNIENCLKRCQLSVNNYVVEPYASGLSCLTDNEKKLGSLLIDIGGSSTSYSVMLDDKLVYVGSSPIGGVNITRDISTVLNISFDMAEKIKNLNSSLLISPIEEREIVKLRFSDIKDDVEIPRVTRLELRDIIQSRLEELFESLKNNLKESGIPIYMLSNIILTGGVTSTVGIDKLASNIFDKNVRIGYPNKPQNNKIKGLASEILNPTHSCSLGMLSFLQDLHMKEKLKEGFESKNNWFTKLLDRFV